MEIENINVGKEEGLSELEKENLQILINKLFNGSKKEITITNSDLTEEEQIILNNLL